MACFDDIAAKLSCICAALQSIANGQPQTGTGNSGIFPAPPSSFVDDGSNYPPGYSTHTEYLDMKCRLARWIIDNVSGDIARITQFQLAGVLATDILALVIATFLSPIPLDELLGISLLIILIYTTLEIGESVTTQAVDYLSNMDICILYNAADVSSAISDWIADIDAQTFSVGDTETKQLLTYFVTNDLLNTLFDDNPQMNLPAADCSSCGGPGGEFQIIEGWGTLTHDGDSYSGDSEQDGSVHRLNFGVVGVEGLEIANWSSDETFGTYFNQITCSDDVSQWLPTHSTPTQPFSQTNLTGKCVKTLRLASAAAFSVSFTVIDCTFTSNCTQSG